MHLALPAQQLYIVHYKLYIKQSILHGNYTLYIIGVFYKLA